MTSRGAPPSSIQEDENELLVLQSDDLFPVPCRLGLCRPRLTRLLAQAMSPRRVQSDDEEVEPGVLGAWHFALEVEGAIIISL